MKKIKQIETKEEWLKLMIDGAKGVSNFTKAITNNSENISYVNYNGQFFEMLFPASEIRRTDETEYAYIDEHSSGFGIIEEPKTKIVKEWMYYNYVEANRWVILGSLATEEEAKLHFKETIYKPTGREWEVEDDN